MTQWEPKDKKRGDLGGEEGGVLGPGLDKGGLGNLRREGKVWMRKEKEGIIRIVAGH